MPRQLTLNKVEVACNLEDELRYSSWIGREVLLAYQVVAGAPAMIFARATLTQFAAYGSDTIAVFTGPKILPDETEITERFQTGPFAIMPGENFAQPVSESHANSAQEAGTLFTRSDLLGQIAAQVRRNAQSICSFSGVETAFSEGLATPIQPQALGGREHVRNFIYLHDEPAQLFNSFAWTVGPDLEIVADAYAMTTQILVTVNPTGKLLVSDDPRQRPDERALAWHREQFLQRLR
ncbi:hypothetical protein [Devosia submarina]|uniref:hypothetical protein n=1 Tax=Devosia submarina TaxID=1173082 RepID=UPI001300A362|nr:hypothetical protein [Devosia submarina]